MNRPDPIQEGIAQATMEGASGSAELSTAELARRSGVPLEEIDFVCSHTLCRAFPWWHLWKWRRYRSMRRHHEVKRDAVREAVRQLVVEELNEQQPKGGIVQVRFS